MAFAAAAAFPLDAFAAAAFFAAALLAALDRAAAALLAALRAAAAFLAAAFCAASLRAAAFSAADFFTAERAETEAFFLADAAFVLAAGDLPRAALDLDTCARCDFAAEAGFVADFPDFPRGLAVEALLAFTGGFFEAMRGALLFPGFFLAKALPRLRGGTSPGGTPTFSSKERAPAPCPPYSHEAGLARVFER